MKELGKRVNLIPVIAKADTVSPLVMHDFKERVGCVDVLQYVVI